MSADPIFDATLLILNTAFPVGQRPRYRLGANVIEVAGRNVDVWVEGIEGEYIASELDYDQGRPAVSRSTIAAAIHDLRELLLDEAGVCQECRDGECEQCGVVDYERENPRY